MNDTFSGDFDLVPIRATLDFGAVPSHPTGDDFHLAVSQLRSAEQESDGGATWKLAGAYWRVEAIRERRSIPGADVCSRAVLARSAARLADWCKANH